MRRCRSKWTAGAMTYVVIAFLELISKGHARSEASKGEGSEGEAAGISIAEFAGQYAPHWTFWKWKISGIDTHTH